MEYLYITSADIEELIERTSKSAQIPSFTDFISLFLRTLQEQGQDIDKGGDEEVRGERKRQKEGKIEWPTHEELEERLHAARTKSKEADEVIASIYGKSRRRYLLFTHATTSARVSDRDLDAEHHDWLLLDALQHFSLTCLMSTLP
jgi:hypothetical protein